MARNITNITIDREVLKWIDERVKKGVFLEPKSCIQVCRHGAYEERMQVGGVLSRLAVQILCFNVT